MSPKIICFIHTETNALHSTEDDVSKKNLYCFARLIKLNYEIGYMQNKAFVTIKKVEQLIKPRACYISQEICDINGISQELAEAKGIDPEIVLNEFKNDIKKTDIIVSHNIDFHLRALIAEATRYNIAIDYNKYIVIDTMSLHPEHQVIKLLTLAKKVLKYKAADVECSTLELIKKVFFSLYKLLIL
jgi:DNA polymerase III alpha subunit (gram-positive type)